MIINTFINYIFTIKMYIFALSKSRSQKFLNFCILFNSKAFDILNHVLLFSLISYIHQSKMIPYYLIVYPLTRTKNRIFSRDSFAEEYVLVAVAACYLMCQMSTSLHGAALAISWDCERRTRNPLDISESPSACNCEAAATWRANYTPLYYGSFHMAFIYDHGGRAREKERGKRKERERERERDSLGGHTMWSLYKSTPYLFARESGYSRNNITFNILHTIYRIALLSAI